MRIFNDYELRKRKGIDEKLTYIGELLDEVQEKFWEFDAKLGALCELLGVAFSHDNEHAYFIQKKEEKK